MFASISIKIEAFDDDGHRLSTITSPTYTDVSNTKIVGYVAEKRLPYGSIEKIGELDPGAYKTPVEFMWVANRGNSGTVNANWGDEYLYHQIAPGGCCLVGANTDARPNEVQVYPVDSDVVIEAFFSVGIFQVEPT